MSLWHPDRLVPKANEILKKLQNFKGVYWFNNNWLPEGMIGNEVSGSGAIGWADSFVQINTGTTSGSVARIYKRATGYDSARSWDKKRHLGMYLRIPTYSNQTAYMLSGGIADPTSATNTSKHIGFMLINNYLYGTVANGTNQSTLLLETISSAVYRRLEAILIPNAECRFYVDGVYKGSISENLPSGTENSEYLFHASIYNAEAVAKYLTFFEVRVLQEE